MPALSMPVCGACLFDCVALVLDLSLVPVLRISEVEYEFVYQLLLINFFGSWDDINAGFEVT